MPEYSEKDYNAIEFAKWISGSPWNSQGEDYWVHAFTDEKATSSKLYGYYIDPIQNVEQQKDYPFKK